MGICAAICGLGQHEKEFQCQKNLNLHRREQNQIALHQRPPLSDQRSSLDFASYGDLHAQVRFASGDMI